MARLQCRRVLITQADRRYLGPRVVDLFRTEGVEVIADEGGLTGPDDARQLVEKFGRIDGLVANFAGPHETMPVTNMLIEPTGSPTLRYGSPWKNRSRPADSATAPRRPRGGTSEDPR